MTDMLDRPLVYVAAPYTNPDPVENTNAAVKAADDLHDTGLVTCVVPHLTLFWHAITPQQYDHWLEYDLALLARCDALLRLPGASSGADKEVKFCLSPERRIPVFYSQPILLDWAKGWAEALTA